LYLRLNASRLVPQQNPSHQQSRPKPRPSPIHSRPRHRPGGFHRFRGNWDPI